MRCFGGRSSAYVLVLKLVKSVCLSLSVCLSIYMCTYMNNHVHSPPQSKKEKNREEKKKNHTPQKKPKFTLYLVLKKCLVFCYTSLSILPSFSPSSQDVLRSTPHTLPSLQSLSPALHTSSPNKAASLHPNIHPTLCRPLSHMCNAHGAVLTIVFPGHWNVLCTCTCVCTGMLTTLPQCLKCFLATGMGCTTRANTVTIP